VVHIILKTMFGGVWLKKSSFADLQPTVLLLALNMICHLCPVSLFGYLVEFLIYFTYHKSIAYQ